MRVPAPLAVLGSALADLVAPEQHTLVVWRDHQRITQPVDLSSPWDLKHKLAWATTHLGQPVHVKVTTTRRRRWAKT